MQDFYGVELAGQPIGDLASAIGRVVIHDQDVMAAICKLRELGSNGTDERLDVGRLVICWNDDPDRAVHGHGRVVVRAGRERSEEATGADRSSRHHLGARATWSAEPRHYAVPLDGV